MRDLMAGKRGLVMGVANDHSIAWGIARHLAEQGATLAFTYQGEAFGSRVKPLAEKLGSSLVLPCDVEDGAIGRSRCSKRSAAEWGTLDFLVHAIGFSDKNELKGLYADTSRDNFVRTMVISCFSFTECARHAAAADAEWRRHAHAHLCRLDPHHAELQRHGRRQGRPRSQRPLPRQRLRAEQHPRERDFGRTGPHAGRGRHIRCHGRCWPGSSAIRR